MTRADLDQLGETLTDRDWHVLGDVSTWRLLDSRQIQRLRFHDHSTAVAGARACNRALQRLRDQQLLRTLQRRIGGVRSGSAGFVWYLAPVGERLLQAHGKRPTGRRSNYREPSRHFVAHTVAVAELAIRTIEAARQGRFDILRLTPEPGSWQQTLSSHGTTQVLKPDLWIITISRDHTTEHENGSAGGGSGGGVVEYEDHWFVEADLDTEHLPVIRRQCLAYDTHRASGRYQADHGVYPAVVWVTPTDSRARAMHGLIAGDEHLDPALFRTTAGPGWPAILSHPLPSKTSP